VKTILLETSATRIYPRDHLPLRRMHSERFRQELIGVFDFNDAELDKTDSDIPKVVFLGREWNGEPKKDPFPGLIELRLEECRIEARCEGPKGHDTIDRFFEELGRFATDNFDWGSGWVQGYEHEVHETVWVGQLDIEPIDFVDPRIRKMRDDVEQLTTSGEPDGKWTSFVTLKDFSFRIMYHIKELPLLQSQIYFKDKEFRLEPRLGVQDSVRQWFSSSPLRSGDHLAILERLEQQFLTKG
jgi:hypothetical protein